MRPGFSRENVVEILRADSKTFCGGGFGTPLRKVHSTYFENLLKRQNRITVSFAFSFWIFSVLIPAPVFANAVSHVVLGSSKEQVVGPDASRIVTMVTDLHPNWDNTECFLKDQPVADPLNRFPLNRTITTVVYASNPVPTLVSFFHSTPEAFPKSTSKTQYSFRRHTVSMCLDFRK